MIAQTTRAVWFAMATVATRTGLRASKATSRGSAVSGLRFTRLMSDVMPTTSSVQRYLSPILVMRPSLSLPPLECCRGVRPNQAANSRPERNWLASVTDAASAVAPIGPMPGTDVKRRAVSFAAAKQVDLGRSPEAAHGCRAPAEIIVRRS